VAAGADHLVDQLAGGGGGKIHAEEILKTKSQLNDMLAGMTGQPLDVIERDTDRDFFMSADEALEYGVVDEVLRNESQS
jgi:ATP-dependent Clp protease protease subunit